jgi:hypothetical protein
MSAARPTLKDVSGAIAHPVTLLHYSRDAVGTHGVRGTVIRKGDPRPVKLASLPESERLGIAISRAQAAASACEQLVELLEARRAYALAGEARR